MTVGVTRSVKSDKVLKNAVTPKVHLIFVIYIFIPNKCHENKLSFFFKISEVTDIVFQVAFKLLDKFASV